MKLSGLSHLDPAARLQHARFLSRILSATHGDSDEVPYMPNAGDDTYWTLDYGNDWKVSFPADEPKCFIIHYRYNSPLNDLESALVNWLVARYGFVIEDATRSTTRGHAIAVAPKSFPF